MDTIFKYIDDNQDRFIKRLADAVAIESVSAEFERRDECHKMMDVTKKQLEDLGATCEMVPNPKGVQTFPCGRQAKFPDIILGRLGTDPNKKTLLVYGHLDVQPAKIEGIINRRQVSCRTTNDNLRWMGLGTVCSSRA